MRREMSGNEISRVFETLMTVPGMNDLVRIEMKLSRKEILLLSQAIKEGSEVSEGMVKNLMGVFPKEQNPDLKAISDTFLEKAGLSALYEKLKAFS